MPDKYTIPLNRPLHTDEVLDSVEAVGDRIERYDAERIEAGEGYGVQLGTVDDDGEWYQMRVVIAQEARDHSAISDVTLEYKSSHDRWNMMDHDVVQLLDETLHRVNSGNTLSRY